MNYKITMKKLTFNCFDLNQDGKVSEKDIYDLIAMYEDDRLFTKIFS